MQATDGNFYGITSSGGANVSGCFSMGCGTVFKMTPAGKLTTLYSFCSQANCTDGTYPSAALIQATDGNFYGTTYQGGANNKSCSPYGCGTIFRITPGGKLTTLYVFCSEANCADGVEPDAGLVEATDGNLYGTTSLGGTHGNGTIFRITLRGKITGLHSFCSQSKCIDGAYPVATLIQATDGSFYGTTKRGGTYHSYCGGPGCGTVFKLSVGLGPFVETNPTSGKVGNTVIILGNNLKSTTSVTFNGTAATLNIVSSTEIKTSVPSGATSGFVKVTTPTKTLK